MTRLRKTARPCSWLAAAAIVFSAAGPHHAFAATEEAWDAFRADVRDKCLAAAEGLFETVEITVDPFGSEHYGLALLRGKARGADATIMAICVYDKATQTAEIGGELPDIVARAEDTASDCASRRRAGA